MPFATKLQTFQGSNTYQNTTASNCIPLWRSGICYVTGGQGGWKTMAKVNVIGGTEADYSDLSLLNDPVLNVDVGTGYAWGIDWDGQLYCRTGLGMSRIDPSDWTRHDSWGAVSYGIFPPPLPTSVGNTNSLGGSIVPIRNGSGTMYWLGGGVGGSFGAFNDIFLQKGSEFAGLTFQDYNPGQLLGCKGLDGGPGFMITSGDSPNPAKIHSVTCIDGAWVPADWPTPNPDITNTVIATVNPTDIDAGWTDITMVGVCLDQKDSNLLVVWSKIDGSAKYLAKHNSTTGALLWKTSINSAITPGQHMQFSNVRGRMYFVVAGHIYGYNTSTGALIIDQTSGLSGLTVPGGQMWDDSTGVIIGNFIQQTPDPDSPTILNTTPPFINNSVAWMALYVAAPPPAGRRFLSESGPIRIIPGPVGPTIGNDILTETGEALITEDDFNIITET